ncbi:hypothetical protein [Microbulbifer sp. GL-2]|uniref:hypothetical protein n=1 Tax=Microbulbifer sp. GL-2 TaxID=2591606 RepID=UPI0011627251|nr:hypothetical protein [Microbulbifer sp. GL-2]BBM03806.1 hypothetical protein GL2_38800 [Microbulbifer sp. GL-2]
MIEDCYRLYAGEIITNHSTFEDAKEAAKKYMPAESYLRIEILKEMGAHKADWWAYEYESNKWVPS